MTNTTQGTSLSDDALLGNGWETLASAVPADLDVRAVRKAVEHYLLRSGLEGEAVDALLVAANEAVTNAVVHGSPDPLVDRVVVEGRVKDGYVQIRTTSRRIDWALPPVHLPRDPLARGLGIYLMRALADHVALVTRDGTSKVVVSKRLR